jgi:hypothetical protein
MIKKLTQGYKFRKFEEKTYFFGLSTMVQNLIKIQGKIQKKVFLGIYPGTKSIVSNLFWLQFVPDTTIEKKIKKHR